MAIDETTQNDLGEGMGMDPNQYHIVTNVLKHLPDFSAYGENKFPAKWFNMVIEGKKSIVIGLSTQANHTMQDGSKKNADAIILAIKQEINRDNSGIFSVPEKEPILFTNKAGSKESGGEFLVIQLDDPSKEHLEALKQLGRGLNALGIARIPEPYAKMVENRRTEASRSGGDFKFT